MSLGAVIFCRNDGWKDNKRVTISLLSFLNEFNEVWYIDWNSPTRSLIEEIRQDIPKTKRLHHVIINAELASELLQCYPDVQSCCENFSRNIGIRRCNTDWIVSASIDIIAPIHNCLMKQLKDENTFYTLSRREAPLEIFDKYNINQIEELRNELLEKIPPRYYLDECCPNDQTSIINCCGDFQIAHRKIWHNIRGFEEGMVYALFSDSNVQKKATTHGFKIKALFEPAAFHIEHANYLTEKTNKPKVSSTKFNNQLVWVDFFDKTTNHRMWGCNEMNLEVEII